MEIQEIILPSSKRLLYVKIERKQIKTSRLKVFPDQTIKLSIPKSAPIGWIIEFLEDKSSWIETKLDKFSKTKNYAATSEIRNGMSIKLLGEDLIFSVAVGNKNVVYKEGKIIYIYSTDIHNQDSLFTLFEKWWKKEALSILSTEVKKLYPIIGKYQVNYPRIVLRKMKTLWGSCSVQRGVVTFNQYLIKAKPACIKYVVLHELVHFIYPNHSKQFYDFLSIHMPDWKERKEILDQDVVHGL
ncbi:MAG TPA: M48 family metallopeptidase [Desulfitobacterium dehalogenans]|uniref:M48 family metallopeptidase n=1 Tax=Desulfitobacterium dehalogenans TaxID=36854 RepID=A0A7C7D466_9FIRM|nr:M48 family metallopeptidase [Desulfitobacterium dehalogenans]